MPLPSELRLLVIAQNPLARAGLTALLEGRAGLNVVGQASGDGELPEALDAFRPDLLVWDMDYEPLTLLDRLADVPLSRLPTLVLLADTESAQDAAPALLAAGVRGVLLHNTPLDRLTAALAALAQGLVALPPHLTSALLNGTLQPDRSPETQADALTPREAEVLRLIAEGLPNKTIAARLKISEHTVKFHVNAILAKFGAQSRTEAVVRATRAGLLTL